VGGERKHGSGAWCGCGWGLTFTAGEDSVGSVNSDRCGGLSVQAIKAMRHLRIVEHAHLW
jgi:hypothetical protein